MTLAIRPTKIADVADILGLYRRAWGSRRGSTGTLLRDILASSLAFGASINARIQPLGVLVGELHAYPVDRRTPGVWSDLTLAVDPEYQDRGIGRMLVNFLLSDVTSGRPEVNRVEALIPLKDRHAVRLFSRLRFDWDLQFEYDESNCARPAQFLRMAWHRPHAPAPVRPAHRSGPLMYEESHSEMEVFS